MSGSGPNIQAHTYIGFKTDNYGDNGSEYQESSEIEDYMAKYTMLQQGWLIMPTLADKGTYVVLSGISIPGMVFGHDSQNNNTVANAPEIMFVGKPGNVRPVIRPSDQVLDQMIEYAKTERRAIQKCMEDLGYSDIPGYTKTRTAPIQDSQKIANYHTPNKDKSTGKIVEPNGTRFTSFTNLVRLGSDNEPIVENLNDPNKSSVELLKLADRLFFNLPIEDQRTIMALTLAQQNAIGIQKAIDLGIIRRVDRTIGNIKISHTSNSNYNLESSHLNKIQIQAVTDAIYRRLCERYSNWNDDDKNSIHGDARARVRERKSLCRGLAIAALISDVENRSIISSQEALRCFVGHPGMFKIDYDFANGRIKDSTADLQKRIGGLVSTGDDNVVGIPGLNTQYNCAEIQDYKVSSPLYENGILHQMFKNGELREVYAILTDDWDSAYSSSLEDIESYLESIKNNPEAELAVKNAYKHIEEFTDSYKDDIDVADGSAFISAEMCKNLLRARGALTDRVKKAFDILTNDNTKYSWKESADAYRAIYNAVNIVTTKYTAYGFRSHTENGVDVSSTAVPYYNKFALFPIFPCIATGKMQALYQKMLKQNVDMVMMQSAVKVGQQGAVKFNGNEIEGDFNVYSQSIGFLRRQLNTDPEEDDFIKAGSQMQKIGLQNLRLGRTYTDPFTGDEISGDDLLAEYMGAVNDLAQMGAEEIREKFFTDGRPDQEKISKYLKDELSSRNANAQLLKALDIDSSTGQMKSPLSATSSSEWIESIIISTVNKAVIDITTPGSSFIQRSVFAMEGSSVEGGSIQVDSNMDVTINNGNKLQMINENGSMDAVISIDYFDHIIPKEIKGFNARKQWLMQHNIIGANAKALTIAYRIPTQGQSSIRALRFVDVIPAVKSTIILPEEFTKITGSDFDIDHLYLASYNINTTDTDTYDIWGGISEKQHAQNTILHMLMILLHDSKNSGHVLYKSIDNDTQLVKKPAGLIPETNSVKHIAYNFGTLHEQVERKKDFITGKDGIGPFALNVTNNILCRLFGVSFRESEVTKNTRLGALYNLVDKDFNSIDAWFSAFINAHVDIVKDPYISKLNVNPYTYNIISLMIRSGFGDTTLWFCSQPIIRDMANAYNMASSQFIRNSHESLYKLREKAVSDAVIKHIGSDRASADQIRKYTDPKNTGLKIQAINWIDNHSDVLKYFATHPNATEYNGYTVKDVQTAVFYAWKVLEPYSMALNSLVQYTKIDTRKQGKNLIEMQVYLYNYHKLRNPDKTKLFDPQSIADLCDNSWIDKKTELAIGLPSEIFSGELFNANSLFVRGCIEIQKLLTGKQEDGQEARINSEFVSDISKQIQTMIKSNWIVGYAKNMKSFNSNMENHTDETLTGLFYGPWTIQFRLNCLHDAVRNNPNYTRLADNYLIQHLVAAKDETDIFIDGKIVQRPKFVTVTDTVADSSVNGDLFSEAWLDLMNDPDVYVQRFARDLAIYAFLTSGEGKGWNQMWKYVPFEFLNGEVDHSDNNSTFVEFVRDVLQYNIFNFSQAATDLIVGNNFMDYRYAKRSVEGFTLKRYDDGTARGSSVSAETFDTLPKYMTVSISGGKKGQQSYALYRKLEVPITTEDGQLIPVYEVVRKRGYQERNGFHIYEYGWDFKYPGNTNVQETHSVSPQTDPDDGGSPNGIDAMAAINNSGEGSVQNSTPWLQIAPANKTAQRAKDIGGVDTLRHPDQNGMHFGNPFSPLKREVESGRAKILTANVKQAVDLFRQWLEGTAYQDVEPERRQWILDKINSGELKDKVFVYYTNNIPDSSYGVAHYDMEHPSHAHVLKQFVDAANVSNDGLQNLPGPEVEMDIWWGSGEKDPNRQNADLSNFAERPFDFREGYEDENSEAFSYFMDLHPFLPEKFDSVEQAFQAFKWAYALSDTDYAKEYITGDTVDKSSESYKRGEKIAEILVEIVNSKSSKEIKNLGGTRGALNKEDIKFWDEHSSEIMKFLIKQSFEQNPQALQRLLATGNATLTHTKDKGKWGIEFPRILMEVREELRKEYSQNTPITIVDSTISTVGYRKGDPQAHKDTAYVFTENAQANAAALGLDDSWVEDGYPKGDMVKTGVSDMNGTNQAGVRATTSGTYGRQNINSNAFGIIVKKYQQDKSGRFIASEGQFKDTDADFELFKTANLDMFKRLEESGLKKIMWPSQMGLGKAALPQRFAEWLQGELGSRFGIVSEIQKNPRADYEGYGLQLTSINTSQPQQTPQSNTSSQPIGTKENPVMIYCDGSDKKGTGKIGYGSVFVHNGKEYVLSGTENGEEIQKLKEQFPNANFSNPTTELLATTITLETIANSGIGEHIHINQDYKGPANWGELWNYSEGSAQREEKPWNTKMPYIKHLVDRAVEAIHKIEQNGGSVKIGWVQGHQKSETEEAVMNNIADRYAKNRDEINTLLDVYNTEQENLYEDWTYEEDSLNSGLFDNPNSTTYSDKC